MIYRKKITSYIGLFALAAAVAVTSATASAAASATASAAEFVLPEYQQYKLDNGMTVYLMEQSEVPLIDVVAVIKTGAVNDTKSGLAQLTADSLLLGTKKKTRKEFEQALDFIGSQVSVEITSEYTKLNASLAAKDLNTVLPMLHDALASPRLDKEEFESLKVRHLAGISREKESPRAMIGKFFNATLFEGHAYANNVSGSETTVASIEHNDVIKFHKTWYQPDNVAIAVVGDFKARDMKKTLNKLFSAWQGQAAKTEEVQATARVDTNQVLLVNKDDATESTFMIGGPGIAFSNPDYVAISIINTVLGGRFTSWLNDELRVNSGLTYGARSRFSRKKSGGSFYMSSFTRTETTVEAIDLALKTYQRLWDQGIDSQTLESAKAYVKGQFPPRFETSGQLADLLANMYVYEFDERYINDFSSQVNRLTVSEASKLIERYFPKDKLQFVVVGKASEISGKLKKYGKLTTVEIGSEI